MKKLFKISYLHFFLGLVFSVIVGSYVYISNSKKVNIQYSGSREFVFTINSCSTIDSSKIFLIDKEDISKAVRGIQSNLPNNAKVSVNLSINSWQMKINGVVEHLKSYDQLITEVIERINVLASARFASIYAHSKVHCNGVQFPAFQFQPATESEYRLQAFRYSTLHLYILTCSPFIVLCLLYLILNYNKYYLSKKE